MSSRQKSAANISRYSYPSYAGEVIRCGCVCLLSLLFAGVSVCCFLLFLVVYNLSVRCFSVGFFRACFLSLVVFAWRCARFFLMLFVVCRLRFGVCFVRCCACWLLMWLGVVFFLCFRLSVRCIFACNFFENFFCFCLVEWECCITFAAALRETMVFRLQR